MFLVFFFGRRSRTRASVSRGISLFLHPVAAADENAQILSETLTSRGKKGDYILNYPNHYIFYYQLLVTTAYSIMGSQVYNPRKKKPCFRDLAPKVRT